jgi:hypothetical protein
MVILKYSLAPRYAYEVEFCSACGDKLSTRLFLLVFAGSLDRWERGMPGFVMLLADRHD